MPLFHIKAVNRDGETIEEDREAPSESALILNLQEDGLLPIRISAAGSSPFAFLRFGKRGAKISHKQVTLFTRELLTLLEAGLPLDRALSVLLELTAKEPDFNAMIGKILEKIKGGAQLSDALEAQGGVFSRFYLNLIRAGEAGGALEVVLDRLTQYLDSSKELRDTVTTAMIYPIILVVMAISSLLLLLTFVVPQFTEMFDSAGKELPIPTQIVVGAAAAIRSWWWTAIPVFAVVSAWVRYQRSDPVRRLIWDGWMLKLPLFGELILKFQVASFSRTLATLLTNGVPLLAGLSIVKDTLDNRLVAQKLGLAVDSLKEGGGMSAPLMEAEIFPSLAMQMIKLGEESAQLPEMLDRVATTYDKEIKISITRLLALLEPVLIVGLGIMIGGIIISILMAILSVNDLAF
ncbi:MAG: type II secretion system F family protein [Methylococcaceae bacterium]|jgi:general secretion pathway protein F|nr:type II secretion system F family protein [Methylococcaceae bacterium]